MFHTLDRPAYGEEGKLQSCGDSGKGWNSLQGDEDTHVINT